MRKLPIYFGETRVVYRDKLALKDVQKQPRIDFEYLPNKRYVTLMVDPDAPSRSEPLYKYWLHWLIINKDETVLEYNPPAPPPNTGEHRYYVYIFEQQNPNKLIIKKPGRTKFNLRSFVNKHQLIPITSSMFRVEHG